VIPAGLAGDASGAMGGRRDDGSADAGLDTSVDRLGRETAEVSTSAGRDSN
jgi:hypothetical protein